MKETMKKRNKNEVDALLRDIETDYHDLQYEVCYTAYRLMSKGLDFDNALSCAKKQFNSE